ncbi:MAG: hypothetical protein ACM3ZC_16700 [Bacteroidota bacterium]
MSGHYHTRGFAEFIFGELSDMAIGALSGVLVSFVLRHSRPKYHWWLGAGLGYGIWFASLAFGHLTKIIKDALTFMAVSSSDDAHTPHGLQDGAVMVAGCLLHALDHCLKLGVCD